MKLQFKEQTFALNMLVNGVTQKAVAEHLCVSVDTIGRLKRTNNDRFKMFAVNDGNFELAIKDKALVIPGCLVTSRLIITGDISDGVVVCKDVYCDEIESGDSEDGFNSDKNDMLEWHLESEDVCACIRPLLVGKVIHTNTEYMAIPGVDLKPNLNIGVPPFDNTLKSLYQWEPLNRYVTPKKTKVEVVAPVSVVKTAKISVADVNPTPEYTWNASNRFISITNARTTYNADSSHPRFKEALALLIDNKITEAIEIINVERAVKRYVKNNVVIENGELFYKNIKLKSSLVDRIIDSMNKGQDFEYYLPFLEKLMLNPSYRSVEQLFNFLEANDIEIDANGDIIAWKRIRDDWMDIHSGTYDNRPGQSPEMPRNMVDDNPENTCSDGLHVCAQSYLDKFATGKEYRTIKVALSPADVVSVPVDYSNSKLRCCKYTVLREVTDL